MSENSPTETTDLDLDCACHVCNPFIHNSSGEAITNLSILIIDNQERIARLERLAGINAKGEWDV